MYSGGLRMKATSQRPRIFCRTLLLAIPLAGIELLSFGFTRLRPELFDRREAFLSQHSFMQWVERIASAIRDGRV